MSDFISLKIVTIGDGHVGKTSLLLCFANNQFDSNYTPTIFDNYSANILHNSQGYTLELWDTAGQEEYDELRPLSYPDTDCFILCFSIIDPSSLFNLKSKWVQDINRVKAPIIVVGCKLDLRDDQDTIGALQKSNLKPVSFEEGKKVAKEIGAFEYVEISSKDKKNIETPFRFAIDAVNSKKEENKTQTKKPNIFELFSSPNLAEKSDIEEYFLKIQK